MKAIVIATKESKSLPVLLASINAYVPPDVVLYIAGNERWGIGRHITTIPNTAANFGDAYNAIVHKAFEKYDEIIVANDDIVLTPTTYGKLAFDVNYLKSLEDVKLGWVASKADYARPSTSVFHMPNTTVEVAVIAPLFAYVSKEAWVDFAPINWYSDDVQCIDMAKRGFRHFASQAYVHHAGSQTIGMDNIKNHLAAEPWIKANRPELHKEWFK